MLAKRSLRAPHCAARRLTNLDLHEGSVNGYGRETTPLFYMRTNKVELCLGKDRLKMYLPSIHKNTTSCHVEDGSASVGQGLEHSPAARADDGSHVLCVLIVLCCCVCL